MAKQSPDEVARHLSEQVDFLRASAAAYDAGVVAEYKRLAHTLRVLLRHRPSSGMHALLHQVGLLGTMQFFDSVGEVFPYSPHSSCALVYMSSGEEPEYVALLDRTHPTFTGEPLTSAFQKDHGRPMLLAHSWESFDTWWHATVVRMIDRGTMSRKDLVLTVANQDGGSHVDPRIKEDYAALSRGNALGWKVLSAVEDRPLGNPVPAAIRQIAYEVAFSLDCRAGSAP